MRSQFLSIAVAAVAFLSPAVRAQEPQVHVFGGSDEDRVASSVFMVEGDSPENMKLHGAVSISYTPPEWRDAYDAQLEKGALNGSNQRLGKNWWTSLDTYSALEIGGVKIPAGSYYLGLHIDQSGKFQLMFLDTKQALSNGWLPFVTMPWKSDLKAPLTLAKGSLEKTVTKMEIEISADEEQPSNGKLAIRWGKHELSAPVKFLMQGAKEASAPKDTGK
jgi:hypothetical protein